MRSIGRSIRVLFCGLLLFAVDCHLIAQTQKIKLSITSLKLREHERIVGFELHIRSAMVTALPHVPPGWNVSIDNDPAWTPVVKGSIVVGAAALDSSSLRDLLILEKDHSLGIPFDLEGTFFLTVDFATTRKVHLHLKDFQLESVKN